VASALTTGDVTRGLTFAFSPDVSKLSANVMLAAIGQAFRPRVPARHADDLSPARSCRCFDTSVRSRSRRCWRRHFLLIQILLNTNFTNY
jgi:hypothetical protein